MSAPTTPAIRIGVCGSETTTARAGRGWAIWSPGYTAALAVAGAEAVLLEQPSGHNGWGAALADVHGVVLAGSDLGGRTPVTDEGGLLQYCRAHRLPLLAIDAGLLALNSAFGGGNYLDLARELPEALQHRHPPEFGLRHAVDVLAGTRLAGLYGEGEIVVNSEHRRAVCRLARGFSVSARALDGVIEAVESEEKNWFALGVQWQPASATASGLDIQLFRGLVEACERRPAR